MLAEIGNHRFAVFVIGLFLCKCCALHSPTSSDAHSEKKAIYDELVKTTTKRPDTDEQGEKGQACNAGNAIDKLSAWDSLKGCRSISNGIDLHFCKDCKLLTGLQELVSLNGDLAIRTNGELENIGSFDNLREINGSIWISGNFKMVNGGEFPRLEVVKGAVGICSNNRILRLPEMKKLTRIEGDFSVSATDLLDRISGFEELQTVGGNLDITSNDKLLNMTGFGKVEKVGHNLLIEHNKSITSLEGLGSLGVIEIGFVLRDNPKLSDLSALQKLKRIGGDLFFSSNENLGLDGILQLPEGLEIDGDVILCGNKKIDDIKRAEKKIRERYHLPGKVWISNEVCYPGSPTGPPW